ncbi:ATP-binding protein [Clostridium cochlearium]|uniref:ATPase family associated with various cellular activities (AAA) n=1 Tax=Clostridium cochlearium TaxID=1494 RepID=A0ABY0QM24_CLOCO|nr:ATP-binding protein [Clostridium cochlearium]NSJ91873.1 ATP-binding protein [Coprococcus sp. MSK.21.13]MDU1443965.1 ATP-binding protein [Clostridium cochlearium]NMA57311.1 ATP-binding protein [Clostridium cochlearium]NME95426.1 ATP-binding protein [Clostridium cochlearium]SDL21764.1 ATPase family associated with various cellular activities (AAA) [Clostridium cochlearium]
MNFNEVLMAVEMVIKTGEVPLIIGESGIGKTSLIRELGNKNNYYVVNIDGNLLKEGEIGGLPTVEEYVIKHTGEKIKRTVYAVHTKLVEIDKALEEDKNRRVLLFIDEINRCEHSVQQELMNIILNREINGYKLSPRVDVIAAMNPSNKYDSFQYTDYQVVDMDPAQEDRFVWIELDADVNTWIKWGMREEVNINKDILQFIASFPEYLHNPSSQESIKATPRSWERVSKAYDVYMREKYPTKIFYNVVKGNIGESIAQDFINFIEENKRPLITPEEIFENEEIHKELERRIKEESHSRLYLEAKNALSYIMDSENKHRDVNIFSKLIQLFPSDLKMGIMQEIKFNYKDIYSEFLENEIFIDGFFKMFQDLK